MIPVRLALADDHAYFRKALVNLLQFTSIEVAIETKNGKALLEAMKTIPVDVVLSDMNMPDTTGTEVLQLIKDNYKDIPVILMSFSNNVSLQKRSLEVGAAAFIHKSVDLSRIVEVILKLQQRK